MEIRNRTPLPALLHVVLDKRAAEHLVVCVKGTWDIGRRGELRPAAEPAPIEPADVHAGEPGRSSVLYEADLGPMKPATDVALVGTAIPPKRGVRSMEVSFRVAALRQRARITGERRWLFPILFWWVASGAKPIERVPLRWEYAVGGSDDTPKNEKHHSLDLRNPLGRGFRARGSKLKRANSPLPQVLDPRTPGRPVGFGFIGGNWQTRRPFAGTYDKAWQEERCPLLPLDFDERFFNSAAPGLTAQGYLTGGETVEVLGCTREGRLSFPLPAVSCQAEAVIDGSPEPIRLELNTVTVDTDAMKLYLLWRGSLRVHGRLPKVAFVRLEAGGLT